jgi:hypothetical protein
MGKVAVGVGVSKDRRKERQGRERRKMDGNIQRKEGGETRAERGGEEGDGLNR